jgi:hypothetical protein
MHFLYYYYGTEMRYKCFIKILWRVYNSILESEGVRLKGGLCVCDQLYYNSQQNFKILFEILQKN